MISQPHKKNQNSHLGLFAGTILGILGKNTKAGDKDLKNLEFKNSTQRLGVRFTDRIRNTFRNKWLKKS